MDSGTVAVKLATHANYAQTMERNVANAQITLKPNSPACIAGIEGFDLVKAGIHPSGSKKEIFIQILPENGAQIDAISADMYHNEIQDTNLLPRGTNAITATGISIISMGTIEATIHWPTGKKSKAIKILFTYYRI